MKLAHYSRRPSHVCPHLILFTGPTCCSFHLCYHFQFFFTFLHTTTCLENKRPQTNVRTATGVQVYVILRGWMGRKPPLVVSVSKQLQGGVACEHLTLMTCMVSRIHVRNACRPCNDHTTILC